MPEKYGLYRGMAFPFGPTLDSYFDTKGDRDILRTSIQMILLTRIKERVMLPGFGSPLPEAVFEPGDEQLDQALEGIVRDNVTFWDRRLEVLDASVTDTPDGNGKVVSVIYRDLATPDVEDRFSFTIPTEVVSRI